LVFEKNARRALLGLKKTSENPIQPPQKNRKKF
jgi:hypothetical protein